MIMDDLEKDCIETPESVVARMDEAARALANELGIPYDAMTTPVELVRIASSTDLKETQVAMDWFAARVAFVDWFGDGTERTKI